MRLTLKGDYALRVIVDLAGRPEGVTVPTRELGRLTAVPRPYLSKIIHALARAGLVRTQRGTGGGIALLEEPRAITLRQVIEAVEGPIYLNRCLVRPGLCPREPACPAHPVWNRIQAIVIKELEAVRMADLATTVPNLTLAARRGMASC